jgi:hypothetical protein
MHATASPRSDVPLFGLYSARNMFCSMLVKMLRRVQTAGITHDTNTADSIAQAEPAHSMVSSDRRAYSTPRFEDHGTIVETTQLRGES